MYDISAGNSSQPIDTMTDDERFTELGQIIAVGIIRMHAKSSSISAEDADSSLAISPGKSVCRTRGRPRVGER
jgi:hypothetical protein